MDIQPERGKGPRSDSWTAGLFSSDKRWCRQKYMIDHITCRTNSQLLAREYNISSRLAKVTTLPPFMFFLKYIKKYYQRCYERPKYNFINNPLRNFKISNCTLNKHWIEEKLHSIFKIFFLLVSEAGNFSANDLLASLLHKFPCLNIIAAA